MMGTSQIHRGDRIRAARELGRAALPALLFVLLVAISGCLGRSPSVRLFTLGTQAQPAESARAPELAVLIGPARLPAYLERPQIARLRAYGEVELDEFNRWVGGFEKNLIRAVEIGVRRQLGSDRVVGYPSGAPFPFDRQVRLHVDEMIVDASNALRVRVRWALLRPGQTASPFSGEEPEGAVAAGTHLFAETVPLRDGSVEALVEAHDAALSQLAQQISLRIAP